MEKKRQYNNHFYAPSVQVTLDFICIDFAKLRGRESKQKKKKYMSPAEFGPATFHTDNWGLRPPGHAGR